MLIAFYPWSQMKKEFDGWEPLRKPRLGLATIKQWKDILDVMCHQQPYRQIVMTPESMQPYDRLIWEMIMPCFRNTVT